MGLWKSFTLRKMAGEKQSVSSAWHREHVLYLLEEVLQGCQLYLGCLLIVLLFYLILTNTLFSFFFLLHHNFGFLKSEEVNNWWIFCLHFAKGERYIYSILVLLITDKVFRIK